MNAHHRPLRAGLILFAVSVAQSALQAEVLREQVISLEAGWNAVHLQVHPTENKPAEVFKGLPVEIAARYFRTLTAVEFIANPDEQRWREEGWGVWYAPDREDAFLSNLHTIQGNQCYLIRVSEDCQWKVTGAVRYERPRWRHASYNLVGFTVDRQSPPTFGDFFAGAEGRIGTRIYRLQNDRWVKVINPSGTPMRSGEAFWTYCDGKTDFAGPLVLDVPATGVLDFGETVNRLELKWRTSSRPQPEVEAVASANPDGERLTVELVTRELDTLTESFTPLEQLTLESADGSRAGSFTMRIRREDFPSSNPCLLLKVSDGAGTLAWVPVSASKATD